MGCLILQQEGERRWQDVDAGGAGAVDVGGGGKPPWPADVGEWCSFQHLDARGEHGDGDGGGTDGQARKAARSSWPQSSQKNQTRTAHQGA